MKGKGEKKRIRGLGATGMCNVKHHQCQLWAAGPGLAPIHKSRCLERLAGPGVDWKRGCGGATRRGLGAGQLE